MCTYVYHEFSHTWLRICIFIFYLLVLRLTMTTLFYLSSILIFIKTDLFYLQPPCEVILMYKNVLYHSLLIWLTDWYMYVYMYFWERQKIHLTVRFFGFGEKWLCHNPLTFYSFCFSFRSEVKFSLHVFDLFFGRKWCYSGKALLYY